MNPDSPRNVAASVRQRLLNRARETGEDFNLILKDFYDILIMSRELSFNADALAAAIAATFKHRKTTLC